MARREGEFYTSIMLDAETHERLSKMAKASECSASKVVRDLIMKSGTDQNIRMRELVQELSDMLGAT